MAATLEPAVPALHVDSPSDNIRDTDMVGESTAGMPSKKTRHRLLRGMQRISSSPSLSRMSRSRSLGNPYNTRASLSCASLGTGLSSGSQPSSNSAPAMPPFSPCGTPLPGTPVTETPAYGDAESPRAVRKIAKADAGAIQGLGAMQESIPLPADVRALARMPGKVRDGDKVKAGTPAVMVDFWASLPFEMRIHILSFLGPLELVRVSRVSRSLYATCFDGQLWKSLDMAELGRRASAEALARIVSAVGPFARNLNLRGCVQVESCRCADAVFKTCKNLNAATLEGCRNLRAASLNGLVTSNADLASLDLTGLTTVTNTTCKMIASSCPRLEVLNVSWCSHVTGSGLAELVRRCSRLRDLRAAEVRGFGDLQTAKEMFVSNRLERLVLSGCADLSDDVLKMMLHGTQPELDILTDIAMVPTRRLRHLDLSRCSRLTNDGVRPMAHLVPDLEGLVLSGCQGIGDGALEAILASTPNLVFLDLADMGGLTNGLFSGHLAKSPCAKRLRHLSVSSCANLSDAGMLPVVKACTALESISLDNTHISDFVLASAAITVQQRTWRTTDPRTYPPRTTLHMTVYDCQNVTAVGIRTVLSRNATSKRGGAGIRADATSGSGPTFPSEIVSLQCSHQYQQTVDEHTRRLLRGDFDAANRLEKRWAGHLQAMEEVASGYASARRRRRRAREVTATLLAVENNGGGATAGSRPRARSAVSCVVM